MPMRTQWRPLEVAPGFFRRSLGGVLARRRLRNGERESAPAGDIHRRERGNLQPPFGTPCAAVEAVPETERLLATLRMKDASCAEISSARGSSAVIRTR